jgi:hypothetical protein
MKRLRPWDVAYAVDMAIVCGISYAIITHVLVHFVDRSDDHELWHGAVVLLAAALSTQQAWQQPILRLVDTVVGIAVGVLSKWLTSYAFYRAIGEPVR